MASKYPTPDYVANLLSVFNRGTEAQRARGAVWYANARHVLQGIAERHGLPLDSVVFACAALSPLRDWRVNIAQTSELIRAVHGKRKTSTGFHFRHCVSVARAALRGELDAVSGLKTRPFALAILGDVTQAVIDTHMLNALGWSRPYSPRTPGMMAKLQDALRSAASAVGLNVATFQAIVWTIQRETVTP